MSAPRTSAATLAALSGIVVVAAVAGGWAVTRPLPQAEELPVCVDTLVNAGEVVSIDQVSVSVYNGSKKNGLATSMMANLTERGFHRASSGNAPTKVKNAQIWSVSPTNPAVMLVKDQFRNAEIVSPPEGAEDLGPGVVVVVGPNATMRPVTKAPTSVVAESGALICTPPGHESLIGE